MKSAKIPTLSRYWWLQSRGFWFVVAAIAGLVAGAVVLRFSPEWAIVLRGYF